MTPEDVLQACLADVTDGRRTPGECAAAHPDQPELQAQLEAALAFRALASLTVSPAAAQRHTAQLRAALAAQPARRRPLGLAAWPRWALAVGLVVALVLGGAGTVSAAGQSLPGQALYGVKRAVEAVQGAFVPAADQAAWHTTLAAIRTSELAALAADPATETYLLEQAAAALSQETEAALAALPTAAGADRAAAAATLLAQINQQLAVLQAAHDRVPSAAQPAIDLALSQSQANQAAALDLATDDPAQPPTATLAVSPLPASATPTRTARPPTDPPPGHNKQTATAAAGANTPAASSTASSLAPGHDKQTATAAATNGAPITATFTPPGNSGSGDPPGTPNCQSPSPNSPNYCTPTPAPTSPDGEASSTPQPEQPTTTPTSESSGGGGPPGGPNCHSPSPNSPNYCTPTPSPP